jgi:PAS domain S-box-containing protein
MKPMSDSLRQTAAALLQNQTVDLSGLSREALLQLIGQMQRHQLALLSENEALRRTQPAIQTTTGGPLKDHPEEGTATTAGEIEEKTLESVYRALADYPLQGMFILKGPQLVFVNRTATELLGYSAQELLSMPIDELSRRTVHPDDRAKVIQRFRDRLTGQPTPDRYEFRVVRKDGTVRWLEQFMDRITYEGEPPLQVVYIDITDRKQAEEALRASEHKFRSVIEQSSDGIVLTDDQGRIIEMNHSYERLTGLARTEKMILLNCRKLYPQEH